MHISIIDDEKMLSTRIAKKLRNNGYSASSFTSYHDFIQKGTHLSDLYIIDVSLGDGSGFDVIQYLRARGATSPIIILSGYGNSENIIYGLNIGADDYVTKPFIPDELVARIQALLRRPKNIENINILSYKSIELNPNNGIVTQNNIPLRLTRKEFFILELLLKSPETIVNRESLMAKIWGIDDVNGDVNANTIHATFSKLRKKLGDDIHIETIPAIGYRIH